MTIQQLEYISVLAEYGQFVEAAEACGVSQSTMSLMVKKLETELDVTIFDRRTQPIRPTEIGWIIIAKARTVLKYCNQISEISKKEKERLRGTLKIGMISTVAPILIPGLFKYLKPHYPNILLEESEMLSLTIKERLRRAELDMGVVAGPVNDPDFLEIPIFHEDFLAYVSPECEAYGQKEIDMDSMLKYPLWLMTENIHFVDGNKTKRIDELLNESFYEGGRVGTMIQIVNECGGMTIIPDSHISRIMYSCHQHLRPIVNPGIRRTISLIIRNDYVHEAILNAVLEGIKLCVPAEKQDSLLKRGPLTI